MHVLGHEVRQRRAVAARDVLVALRQVLVDVSQAAVEAGLVVGEARGLGGTWRGERDGSVWRLGHEREKGNDSEHFIFIF